MTEALPRVHLAIDNCFASKRWTRPSEWMEIVAGLGLKNIEASTDTECDPLYMDGEYLNDWIEEVRRQSIRRGLRVVNLHSGHGTYSTLGLAHTDRRNRNKFHHDWMESLILMAEKLGAGVGFYCHAFNDSVLQDSSQYEAMQTELFDRFADLAEFAGKHGRTTLGVEQMYTPHQIPWTISGAESLLEKVNGRNAYPFYITIDTGHQTAQRLFRRPSEEAIRMAVNPSSAPIDVPNAEKIWIGPNSCIDILERCRTTRDQTQINIEMEKMRIEMDSHPYLFATVEDADPYAWLSRVGCFSPIIHLQQTDGTSSSHQPFTHEFNTNGRITGLKVLEALAQSYRNPTPGGLPPRCTDIYLTLEIFFKTSELSMNIIRSLEFSVAYWRRFIPIDGLSLDQLVPMSETRKVADQHCSPS
ncbi:MAG: sugar phosphate isomerase/epimerase family protein [Rectinemataceae bacterium]